MKKLTTILCLAAMISCNQSPYDYNVVIVGAGLAGLSASAELNSKNSLIIEKENLVGGRVLTSSFNENYFYDLGAVFAPNEEYRDKIGLNATVILPSDTIAFWYDSVIYKGLDIVTCLQQIDTLSHLDLASLSNQETFNAAETDSVLYDFLNTNMKAVFPAALKEYNENVQPYAWSRYRASYFEKGNQAVSDHFMKKSSSHLKLNSEVIKVNDMGDFVEVIYQFNDIPDTVAAKSVIVATPSFVANEILTSVNPITQEFLDGVVYAGYYTVAVAFIGLAGPPDMAYLMPVGTGFSSIVKQVTSDKQFTTFLLYVAEEDFGEFKDDADITEKAIQTLESIWEVNRDHIRLTQVKLWEQAGVIVNNHYLEERTEDVLRPSENVVLAGDYCHFEYGVPYGMIPAIESGKHAVQILKKHRLDR